MKRTRNLNKQSISKRFLHNSTLPKGKAEELRDVEKDTLKSQEQAEQPWRVMDRLANAINRWIIGEANFNKSFSIWGKKGYWQGTCLRLLPNIRGHEIIVHKVHDYLKLYFNISWKERRIELYGWRNRKHNKYLRAMYKRLETARKKKDLFEDCLVSTGNVGELRRESAANTAYWNLAYFLMTRSTVFQVLHMNKVLNKERTWPGRESLSKIIQTMNQVRKKLTHGNWMEIEVWRVWIDDNKRPLGVPGLADRIIGSMLSNLLEFYLWETIQINQGYQTGKGSGTAWGKILGNGQVENTTGLLRYPWIWEYDLDGCFNRLNQVVLGDLLRRIGLPSWLWMSLLRMQKRSPRIHGNSGGETIEEDSYGNTLEEQTGSGKRFVYWNGHSVEGVAQGHSLSPILSLILIEHANRSFMKREVMRGNETLGYADDGLFFCCSEFPVQEYANHIRGWGMHLAIKKCGYIRRNFRWEKGIKFLGLLYDPFEEKLKAWTRKGSRVILEDSVSQVWRGGEYYGIVRGIFHREEKYDRLGEWKEYDETQLTWELGFLWLILTLSWIHWSVCVVGLLYLYSWRWIHGGVFVLIPLYLYLGTEKLLWPTVLVWLVIENLNIAEYKVESERGKTQQITWRLVVRAWKLNAFIARLYNGQMADRLIPQDFKLQINPHSLLWHLKNTESSDKIWKGWETEKIELNKTYLEKIEDDLGSELSFATATSVGCYCLIDYLSSGSGKEEESPPHPGQLHRKLIARLNLGGYWTEIPETKVIKAPGMMSVRLYRDNPLSRSYRGGDRHLGREGPIEQLENRVDWNYQIAVGWRGSLLADRHRWCQAWPPDGRGAQVKRRLYNQYRLHQLVGWVPIISKHKNRLGKPQATKPKNHLYVMEVPTLSEALFESERYEYFGNPRNLRSSIREWSSPYSMYPYWRTNLRKLLREPE